jgi:hypothetical protein
MGPAPLRAARVRAAKQKGPPRGWQAGPSAYLDAKKGALHGSRRRTYRHMLRGVGAVRRRGARPAGGGGVARLPVVPEPPALLPLLPAMRARRQIRHRRRVRDGKRVVAAVGLEAIIPDGSSCAGRGACLGGGGVGGRAVGAVTQRDSEVEVVYEHSRRRGRAGSVRPRQRRAQRRERVREPPCVLRHRSQRPLVTAQATRSPLRCGFGGWCADRVPGGRAGGRVGGRACCAPARKQRTKRAPGPARSRSNACSRAGAPARGPAARRVSLLPAAPCAGFGRRLRAQASGVGFGRRLRAQASGAGFGCRLGCAALEPLAYRARRRGVQARAAGAWGRGAGGAWEAGPVSEGEGAREINAAEAAVCREGPVRCGRLGERVIILPAASVQLVRRDGRDVSTLYRREERGGGGACRGPRH